MSDLSKAHDRLRAWLQRHPADVEIRKVADELKRLLAGGEAAAPDVPKLVKDGEELGADLIKLYGDYMAKTVSVSDIIKAGQDASAAVVDAEKALADFRAAYSAA